MKIIGGRHRGRKLQAPKGQTTRPTSARAREAVFNILSHGISGFTIVDVNVMDVFAGSGGLGFEALSRGARHCIFIEHKAATIKIISENAAQLHEQDSISLIKTDTRFLPPPSEDTNAPCGLFFLDPPYGKKFIEPTLNSLLQQNWLGPKAIGVVEYRAGEQISWPAGFEILQQKKYGAAEITLIRRND